MVASVGPSIDELDFRGLKMLKEKMKGKRMIHSGNTITQGHDRCLGGGQFVFKYLIIYIYILICVDIFLTCMIYIYIIYECLFAI